MSAGYYNEMKALSRSLREQHNLADPRVLKSDMKRIYKKQGIQLDYWPGKFRSLRGAYFDDEHGTSVVVSEHLPNDPLIFTMAHELKHHLVDRSLKTLECTAKNISKLVEVGAEVFAAELLFPDAIFHQKMDEMKVPKETCDERVLVKLKRETRTTLSYQGLTKKAEFLGYARRGAIKQGSWRRIEVELFGPPLFRRR